MALRVDYAGWPAGTEATLVEAYADGGVIEVDDDGRTLDLLTVPYSVLTSGGSGDGAGAGEPAGQLGEDRQTDLEPHPV